MNALALTAYDIATTAMILLLFVAALIAGSGFRFDTWWAKLFVVMFAVIVVVGTIAAFNLPSAGAMNPVRKDYDGSSPQLEEWIAATWPVELVDEVINVAWCESRGKATARNGQYVGIFQIGRREWAKFGKGDPFDPYANSAAAYRYWSYVERTSPGKGWLRWECRP